MSIYRFTIHVGLNEIEDVAPVIHINIAAPTLEDALVQLPMYVENFDFGKSA